MKKSQNMPVWLRKMVLASTFASAEDWKRHNKDVHLPEESVIHMI
jgi:hypothetical protein